MISIKGKNSIYVYINVKEKNLYSDNMVTRPFKIGRSCNSVTKCGTNPTEK